MSDCQEVITSDDRSRTALYAALTIAFEAAAVAVTAQQHAGTNDPVTLAHVRAGDDPMA